MCRGGFHPLPEDGPLNRAGTLVLVGNAGPDLWRAFERGRRDEPDPLDRWTRRLVSAAAVELGASAALFPFDGPPYHPFQRWALKADRVHPSPLGILIHPDFGLWHAYRAALCFEARLALPARPMESSPCDGCRDRPCLTACPVSAFSVNGYEVDGCANHVSSAAGTSCREQGCLARHACPVGQAYRYVPAQAGFHMAHFLTSRHPRPKAKP